MAQPPPSGKQPGAPRGTQSSACLPTRPRHPLVKGTMRRYNMAAAHHSYARGQIRVPAARAQARRLTPTAAWGKGATGCRPAVRTFRAPQGPARHIAAAITVTPVITHMAGRPAPRRARKPYRKPSCPTAKSASRSFSAGVRPNMTSASSPAYRSSRRWTHPSTNPCPSTWTAAASGAPARNCWTAPPTSPPATPTACPPSRWKSPPARAACWWSRPPSCSASPGAYPSTWPSPPSTAPTAKTATCRVCSRPWAFPTPACACWRPPSSWTRRPPSRPFPARAFPCCLARCCASPWVACCPRAPR